MTQTASTFNKRWDYITTIWQDNRWLLVFAGWLFGLLTFPMLQLIDTNWRSLLYNLIPEAVGIVFTVLILDRLSENRAENRTRLELQKRLISEARSQSNETAKAAVDWLRAEGWLTTKDNIALLKAATLVNAKLQGADLHKANLQGANLGRANLERANLGFANLQAAHLRYANLERANLGNADLERANLGRVNLHAAHLEYAKLQTAHLGNANLQAAHLEYAKLQGANLWRVNMQEANLGLAKLQEANLGDANLQAADLRFADLERVYLSEANLQRAHFGFANLQAVNFGRANLQAADLSFAKLQGAYLGDANLCEVNFEGAKFDVRTVLPDARPMQDENGMYLEDENGNYIYDKYWTTETDMTRYTNPKHPNFWVPEYLKPDNKGGKPWWVRQQGNNNEWRSEPIPAHYE